MTERWRDVRGYEGRYQVSTKGRVRNRFGRVLKPNTKSPRYYTVRLYLGRRDEYEDRLIHRLVAETFLVKPSDRHEVNHIDGDRYNNSVENLEWVTHRENMMHAVRAGLVTTKPANKARWRDRRTA